MQFKMHDLQKESEIQDHLQPQQHAACSWAEWNFETCRRFDQAVHSILTTLPPAPARPPAIWGNIARLPTVNDGRCSDTGHLLHAAMCSSWKLNCSSRIVYSFLATSRPQLTTNFRNILRLSVIDCRQRSSCFDRLTCVCSHIPNRVDVLRLFCRVVSNPKLSPPFAGWHRLSGFRDCKSNRQQGIHTLSKRWLDLRLTFFEEIDHYFGLLCMAHHHLTCKAKCREKVLWNIIVFYCFWSSLWERELVPRNGIHVRYIPSHKIDFQCWSCWCGCRCRCRWGDRGGASSSLMRAVALPGWPGSLSSQFKCRAWK